MKRILVLTILVFALLINVAHAVPITYYFGGELQNDFGTLVTGATFTGQFTYESTSPVIIPGLALDTYNLTSFDTTFDTLFTGANSTIAIWNYGSIGGYEDIVHIESFPMPGSMFGGIGLAFLDLKLFDFTGRIFNTTELPGSDMSLSDFDASSRIKFIGIDGTEGLGHFTFLSTEPPAPAPVPEPATILLMSTGLAGLGFYKRKRNNKKGR